MNHFFNVLWYSIVTLYRCFVIIFILNIHDTYYGRAIKICFSRFFFCLSALFVCLLRGFYIPREMSYGNYTFRNKILFLKAMLSPRGKYFFLKNVKFSDGFWWMLSSHFSRCKMDGTNKEVNVIHKSEIFKHWRRKE